MHVFINGKAMQLADGLSLAGLLAELGLDPKSCATAINGQFVARDTRAHTTLAEGDQVMTFEPITGG